MPYNLLFKTVLLIRELDLVDNKEALSLTKQFIYGLEDHNAFIKKAMLHFIIIKLTEKGITKDEIVNLLKIPDRTV